MSRMFCTPGSKEAVGSLIAGEFSPNAFAAANSILSVTRCACDATNPRPTAGNMYTLLHWAMSILFPPYLAGPNGEPVATSTLPSGHEIKTLASASEWLVGLDSGKMIGRAAFLALLRTIGSE